MNEQKIYPHFIGRLGNNLFQIAACIGYAKRHNVGWGIRKGYVEQGFQAFQVDQFLPWLPSCPHTFRGYSEPYFHHQEIPYHEQGVRLVGFWQSEKYFVNAIDEVKKWIKVPHVPGYSGFVSIHVRRGDYVQHAASFPPVTVEYIEQSLNKIRTGRALVCSDDIQWCKDNLGHLNTSQLQIEFSEGRNEFEDLAAMASCDHHIISNSTLAWWAAWLGHNPEKTVVCPHHLNWFGPANPHREDTFDLFPPTWNEIKFR